VKLRNVQSALLAASGLLIAVVPFSAGAAETTVTGVVRDSSGVPQMDVLVQLMRADSTVIETVRTDAHGTYLIAGILPGIYQLKAIETSFLPTLRENLRVNGRSRTEANLTLSTLMEALSWLPAHKRDVTEPQDDWTWTLRSAAYRPLLRYVDSDGLETVESGETSAARKKGRVMIESGAHAFGQGGVQQMVELQHQEKRGSQTLLRGRVSDLPGGVTRLTAGYSQQNMVGSGMTSVIAFQTNPGVTGAHGMGMQTIALRSADTIRLLPELMLEAGSEIEMFGLAGQSATAVRPFANVTWTKGNTTVSYVLQTAPRMGGSSALAADDASANLTGEQNGVVRMEHGLHQEIKAEYAGSSFDASAAMYQDRVVNPMLDAVGTVDGAELASGNYLFDPVTAMTRVVGDDYSSRGVVMQVTHHGAGSIHETVEFATGSALSAPERAIGPQSPAFRAANAESMTLLLGGKLPRSGTTWRTSYRLQPGDSVNAVDLFESRVADAYLSVFLRQPLHHGRIFPGGVDAVIDVKNLLAQGYHPFLTSDGNTLFFAQVDRSVSGGLAFYF
jgi:hypothetical protein